MPTDNNSHRYISDSPRVMRSRTFRGDGVEIEDLLDGAPETPTPNNIDTDKMKLVIVEALLRTEIFEQSGAEDYLNTVLKADRNKLIKHLSFYYGLPEAEMKKVAEQIK